LLLSLRWPTAASLGDGPREHRRERLSKLFAPGRQSRIEPIANFLDHALRQLLVDELAIPRCTDSSGWTKGKKNWMRSNQ
jgi:hypothetical protein